MTHSPDPFFTLKPGYSVVTTAAEFFSIISNSKSGVVKDILFEPNLLKPADKNSRKISDLTFENVSFSKKEIQDIVFDNCTFVECLFIHTTVRKCEFIKCTFVRTNVNKITIIDSYLDPDSFLRCLDKRRHQNIGVRLYQQLMNNSDDQRQPIFEAKARFMFFRWRRYELKYLLNKPQTFKWRPKEVYIHRALISQIAYSKIWEFAFGSGIRLSSYVRTVLFVIISLSIINWLLAERLGLKFGDIQVERFSDALYFTIITLTTLGYGDITPKTEIGRLAVAGYAILGFALFAILASMITRKVAP
ncbi:ion channel [Mesorhizobium sp. M0074]|uniref:potassium channel family protein n=1 Tax=Mesorhizobium sp. M0074 TaxID=2956869 RepID=UPI00333AFB3B